MGNSCCLPFKRWKHKSRSKTNTTSLMVGLKRFNKGPLFHHTPLVVNVELCEDCKKEVIFKYYGNYKKCPMCKTETPL